MRQQHDACATRYSCIGTLKSTRTRAVLPSQSTSRTVQRRTLFLAGSRRCQPRVLAPGAGVTHDLLEDGAIRGCLAAQVAGDKRRDVRQSAGIAKLVVVPADHLDQVAYDQRIQPAEDRRTRIALEVARAERGLGGAEGADQAGLSV